MPQTPLVEKQLTASEYVRDIVTGMSAVENSRPQEN